MISKPSYRNQLWPRPFVLRQFLPGGGAPVFDAGSAGAAEESVQLAPQPGQQLPVGGVGNQVSGFARIGFEVVELAGPLPGALHEFQVAGTDSAHVLVLEEEAVAPVRHILAQ